MSCSLENPCDEKEVCDIKREKCLSLDDRKGLYPEGIVETVIFGRKFIGERWKILLFLRNLFWNKMKVKCTLGMDSIELTDFGNMVVNRNNKNIITFLNVSESSGGRKFDVLCSVRNDLLDYWDGKKTTYQGVLIQKGESKEEKKQRREAVFRGEEKSSYFYNFPFWDSVFIERDVAEKILKSKKFMFVLFKTQFVFLDTIPSGVSSYHNTDRGGDTVYAVVPVGVDGKVDRTRIKETHYESGKLESRKTYVDSELHGLYEEWEENGQIGMRGMYKNGKKEGLWEIWYENGKLASKKEYKNGKLEGLTEAYYENGNLYYKEEYKNGKLVTSTYWAKNGNLSSRIEFKNNGKDKLTETYHENGNPRSREEYKNGKPVTFTYWDKNGNLTSRIEFKNNAQDKLIENYYENGIMKSKFTITTDNKYKGSYKYWYKNGKLKTKGEYKNGEKDGLWKKWDEDGNLESSEEYKDGEKI